MRTGPSMGCCGALVMALACGGPTQGGHASVGEPVAMGRGRVSAPSGEVRYELAGQRSKPTVVFVSAPVQSMSAWDSMVGPVGDAGFQTLRYEGLDGASVRDGPGAVLDAVGLPNEPVLIVGAGAGSQAVVGFARRHPERLDKVALVVPDGLQAPDRQQLSKLRVPLLWCGSDEATRRALPNAEWVQLDPRADPLRRDAGQILSRLIPFLMQGIAKGHNAPDQH